MWNKKHIKLAVDGKLVRECHHWACMHRQMDIQNNASGGP